MNAYGVLNIVSDVRLCLDEAGVNESELIGGTDKTEMDAVIKSKIPDAIRYVYLNADLALIVPISAEGKTTSDSQGVVRVAFPSDYLRLVFAQLEDWEFHATEAIMHTDKRYATLKNPITTGYPDNPKVAINDVGDAAKVLEFYSSATKDGEVGYLYNYIGTPAVYKTNITDESGNTTEVDTYDIDDRVYRAVVYHAAGLTMLTFKDAHADAMFNMALTLMGAK